MEGENEREKREKEKRRVRESVVLKLLSVRSAHPASPRPLASPSHRALKVVL